MSTVFKSALLLTSVLLAAEFVPARASGWNRKISDIRIVHPPGTPPGTWRVLGTLGIGDDSAPGGSNLGCDLTLSLNGSPLELVAIPVTPSAAPNNCSGCDGTPCVLFFGPWGSAWGGCQAGFSSGCGCGLLIDIGGGGPGSTSFTDFQYQPGDVLGVTVVAGPGSLPEIDTSDDTFFLTVGENEPGIGYCSGDGTLATACPCANNGLPGNGCANSGNPAGAHLASTGFIETDPLTGTDTVVLHGSGMPATATAIYLKGSASNPSGAVFGDGVRCVAGSLIRLRTKINVGGASRFPEPGDPSLSVRGATPYGSGLSAWYQVYYRNPASWCTAATFNISNGLRIDW